MDTALSTARAWHRHRVPHIALKQVTYVSPSAAELPLSPVSLDFGLLIPLVFVLVTAPAHPVLRPLTASHHSTIKVQVFAKSQDQGPASGDC